MYVAQLNFNLQQNSDTELALDSINGLLGTLRMNGQTLGNEFPTVLKDYQFRTFVLIPEISSLDKGLANKYVRKGLCNLEEINVNFSYEIIGEEPNSTDICECSHSSRYILFTNDGSIESPLRCYDCFGVIPLYKIPHTYDEEYYNIICWMSDYQSCDSLQMGCLTGERFGTQQISKYDSSLSRRGIEICNKISELTGVKTYYYLYRYTALGRKSEINRKCPSCGGEWLLNEPLHNLFDFCCHKCRLLSNISWSVSKSG